MWVSIYDGLMGILWWLNRNQKDLMGFTGIYHNLARGPPIMSWLQLVYKPSNSLLVGGWPTPVKNDGAKVSWDDDIPNWMEK